MTDSSPYPVGTPPPSVWDTPLKVPGKSVLKAVVSAAVHVYKGDLPELSKDAADVLSEFGVEAGPGVLGWLLVKRALVRAMITLAKDQPAVKSHLEKHTLSDPFDPTHSLNHETLEISPDFFEHPERLSLLGPCGESFATWLGANGADPQEAEFAKRRLPSAFVLAIHQEWAAHPDTYGPLKSAVDTPFTKAVENEITWRTYQARLMADVRARVFGEPFGLADVYIPLRAYYEEPVKVNPQRGETERPDVVRRVVVDIGEELDRWVVRPRGEIHQRPIRALSAGPGAGKTSVLRMYASHRAALRDPKVALVPIYLLGAIGQSAGEALVDYLTTACGLPRDALDGKASRLLLLVDGLDEIEALGSSSLEKAKEFLERLERYVRLLNEGDREIQVIVSGRELVIQEYRSRFADTGGVLHLLPYLVDDGEEYKDEQGLLSGPNADQRKLWWQKYGEVSGRGYQELPAALDRRDLDELSAQPLLNFLLAVDLKHGELFRDAAIQSDVFYLSEIYGDIIRSVLRREKEKRRLRELEDDDFIAVLEEVAVAAWHNNGRSAALADIERRCKYAGLEAVLERVQEEAQQGLLSILIAFFFRQASGARRGDETFEFTHKSFSEYLTVRRIRVELDGITEQLAEAGTRRTRYGETEALVDWARLCGPSPLDLDLLAFLKDEIQASDSRRPGVAVSWQRTAICLIEASL